MATSKKPETKKTAAKKAADKKPAVPTLTDDFPQAYIRLRTVLDALETGALQYCLGGTTDERVKRAEQIEEWLIPILSKFKKKPSKPPYTSCAEGYYNCGGVCVPYPCPPTDR